MIKNDRKLDNINIFYILVFFFLIVITANVHLWLHYSSYPVLLRYAIIIIGLFYGVGLPYGMYQSRAEWIRIKWNDIGLVRKIHFVSRRNEIAIKWSDISNIRITINNLRQESLAATIQALEKNMEIKRSLFDCKDIAMVQIEISEKTEKTIFVTSRMFSYRHLITFLIIIKQYTGFE